MKGNEEGRKFEKKKKVGKKLEKRSTIHSSKQNVIPASYLLF